MTATAVPRIFERRQFAAKMERARHRRQHLGGASYLADALAEDVIDRLDFMNFVPRRARVIGDATEGLVHHLEAAGCDVTQDVLGVFDEELPGSWQPVDLVVHLLGLGMVNDLPGALILARSALAEGGLFIAAFPGAGSLSTLRGLALAADAERPAARMHPLVDLRGATGLMERAGFRRQVVDSFPLRVRYPSLTRMVADLRDHGLTRSLTSPAPALNRAWLSRATAEFEALREGDGQGGKVTERFEMLVLTGWR